MPDKVKAGGASSTDALSEGVWLHLNPPGAGAPDWMPDNANSDSVSSTLGHGVEATEFMHSKHTQQQVERDVQELLDIFVARGDCRKFLASLPLYVAEILGAPNSLTDATQRFDLATQSLLRDKVNSAVALQVRPFYADCM
eukprot:976230-Lingulodinium_polyedra.AAC.1